jgi:energy-coupling factor transport system substrate-specific component
MHDFFQAIGLIFGIIISCIAVGAILVRFNNAYQTQANIDLLALINPQPRIWRIDQRRRAALLLGAIIYGVALYIIDVLDYSTMAPNWNWVYSLPVAVLLFFGAVYGPWVGLFVGVVGELLLAIIAARVYSSSFFFPTSGVIGDAITGFIAGLSFAFTRGRFNNVRAFVVVEIIGGIGIILGDLFYSAIAQNQFNNNGFQGSFGQTFAAIILPDLVCGLVLLPILLTLYNKSFFYES